MCSTWPALYLQLFPNLNLFIILHLFGGINSLNGAPDMNICSWFIPAPWRHPLSLHTMDNNRCFMEPKDWCEVSSLYMAGIPGTLIHLQSSKVRARCLLRSIKLQRSLGGCLSVLRHAEELITMVSMSFSSSTASFFFFTFCHPSPLAMNPSWKLWPCKISHNYIYDNTWLLMTISI